MIIVTGGAGFIGSAFVWKCNAEGLTDILVVDNLGKSEKWQNLVGLKFVDYMHKEDFINKVRDGKFKSKVDSIIHMGACSSTTEEDLDFLMENNYRYTQTLAEWALKNDARFIYASSAATYGDGSCGFEDKHDGLTFLRPINKYGYSKHIFDLYALSKGLIDKITGLKFFNVFGPNEYHKGDMRSVICKAYEQIRDTGALKLFKSHRPDYKDGEQVRDFVYIKDCIEIMWWLFNNKNVTGIYNIGTGKSRGWNDLAKAIFIAMEKAVNIEYIDMPENIRDQYQYYTEARMDKLERKGCHHHFSSLEAAVSDYVGAYLNKGQKSLVF
ncbi:ADP-glyceromanno-heptose 6-epimerase [Candidatus Margulisiibacteriota bacterium]